MSFRRASGFSGPLTCGSWGIGRPASGSAPGDINTNRDVHILQVIGKLAPGVPARVAQAELDAHAARLAREYPQTNAGYGVALESLIPRSWATQGSLSRSARSDCDAARDRVGERREPDARAHEPSLPRTDDAQRAGASQSRIITLILIEAGLDRRNRWTARASSRRDGGEGARESCAAGPAVASIEVTLDARVLMSGLLLTLLTGLRLWPLACLACLATNAASALAGCGRALPPGVIGVALSIYWSEVNWRWRRSCW